MTELNADFVQVLDPKSKRYLLIDRAMGAVFGRRDTPWPNVDIILYADDAAKEPKE